MEKTARGQENDVNYCLFLKQSEKITKTWQACKGNHVKINNFEIADADGI